MDVRFLGSEVAKCYRSFYSPRLTFKSRSSLLRISNLYVLQWIQVRTKILRDFMETGKKTASSLEDWLDMLEKAHTNEEYSAVALALPDRKTQDLWWAKTETPSSSTKEPKTPLG